MKGSKTALSQAKPVIDAVMSVLTFCVVVGGLYWLIREACGAVFTAIVSH